MTFNIATYYNESFGIDSADHVDVAAAIEHLDELDSSIDDELEASYH